MFYVRRARRRTLFLVVWLSEYLLLFCISHVWRVRILFPEYFCKIRCLEVVESCPKNRDITFNTAYLLLCGMNLTEKTKRCQKCTVRTRTKRTREKRFSVFSKNFLFVVPSLLIICRTMMEKVEISRYISPSSFSIPPPNCSYRTWKGGGLYHNFGVQGGGSAPAADLVSGL